SGASEANARGFLPAGRLAIDLGQRAYAGNLALRGKPLFRASQPWELSVQQGDSLGRGWAGGGAERGGRGRRRHQGDPCPARTLVTPERSAATRSDEAQLQRRFIKEHIRVVSHGCLPTPHSLHCRTQASQKCL